MQQPLKIQSKPKKLPPKALQKVQIDFSSFTVIIQNYICIHLCTIILFFSTTKSKERIKTDNFNQNCRFVFCVQFNWTQFFHGSNKFESQLCSSKQWRNENGKSEDLFYLNYVILMMQWVSALLVTVLWVAGKIAGLRHRFFLLKIEDKEFLHRISTQSLDFIQKNLIKIQISKNSRSKTSLKSRRHVYRFFSPNSTANFPQYNNIHPHISHVSKLHRRMLWFRELYFLHISLNYFSSLQMTINSNLFFYIFLWI